MEPRPAGGVFPKAMATDLVQESSHHDAEEVDKELLELPDPPRQERTWTVVLMVLAAIASVTMAVAIRRDVAFAFGPAAPQNVGELSTVAGTSLQENAFVRAHGTLGAAGAIRFERPLVEGSYRVAPVAGRTDLWVEMRVPEGGENGRFVPDAEFTGRVVRLSGAGLKHRALDGAVSNALGERVPDDAWLIVSDETPRGARGSIALAIMCLVFAVWNVAAIARLFRRVRE